MIRTIIGKISKQTLDYKAITCMVIPGNFYFNHEILFFVTYHKFQNFTIMCMTIILFGVLYLLRPNDPGLVPVSPPLIYAYVPIHKRFKKNNIDFKNENN